MRKVSKLNIKKSVFNDDYCSGCKKEITGSYNRIKLQYDDHDEYIALCDKCYAGAVKHNVHFNDI